MVAIGVCESMKGSDEGTTCGVVVSQVVESGAEFLREKEAARVGRVLSCFVVSKRMNNGRS